MKTYLVVFAFVGVLLNPLIAQDFKRMNDPTIFQKKMQQTARTTTSLQSDFIQVKHLDVLSEDITSDGRLCFKKENNLRWEYISPIRYTIVLCAGKVSIKDEGKLSSYDLSANKTFQKISEMVVRSIQGDLVLDKVAYQYIFQENSVQYLVELLPKDEKVRSFMERIQIYFSKKNLRVQSVKMIEQSGDYTLMKFKNQIFNESISDSLFSLH